MNDTVTISRKEYDALVKDSRWLGSLEAAGVDNWEGFSFAYDLHREVHGDGDDADES